MATILEEYGIRPIQPHNVTGLGKVSSPHVVTSTEFVGIEVEVENVGLLPAMNRVWQHHEDASLRNGGAELVTQPILATVAPVCLEHLFTQVLSAECCFGPRTSVHVHLNVQDLTRPQTMDLILLYSIYEKLFYKFVGKGREKNIYCVPLYDCDMLPNLIDLGETRNNRWSKYTGFNTLPIRTYGTVEFRHMHGTTDVAKLAMWINLICKLKEYVRRVGTKDIRTMIATMNDEFDFGNLLQEVFGEYARAFRYEGPHELNYLQAKQALAARATTRAFMTGASKASAFYTFKE